jgi:TolB protein
MLARAYRLTDKVGIVVLKSSAAVSSTTLSGVQITAGAVRRSLATVFGLLLLVVLTIGRAVYRVLRIAALIIWRIFSSIFGAVGTVARFFFNLVWRSSGQVATVSASSVMARRAARAEMEVGLAEDPLRAQNRLLGALTVVLLGALIGVVLWATDPSRRSALSVSPNLNVNFAPLSSQAAATSPALISTPVPTATALPSVLEAGGSLVYTVRERGHTHIWAVNVGSRTPIRLTNSPSDERDAVWSPDGKRLAFASHQDGNWELYVYELATGTTSRMTYDLSFQGAPGWSPDGQWLTYESYQGNNLDIYVLPLDGSQPARRVTSNPAPDFAPAWSPDGRRIAFVSWRDGNQDIYIFSLDNPNDSAVVNLTNTPTRQEDYPAWSPDGKLLAYSAVDNGIEKVFVKAADDAKAEAQVIGRGRQPAWSPDGSSLVFAVSALEGTQLVAAPFTDAGVATLVVPVSPNSSRPGWTNAPLPAPLVNAGGVGPASSQPLYIEQESKPDKDGLYRLGQLTSVNAPSAYLSERVNDSFNALRQETLQQAGWDFLGDLEDAFWKLDRPPQPGEELRNWYKTGRQFGINRNLIAGFPARVEVFREDTDIQTYWRVYVRVVDEEQSGRLGEPLRRMPWDMLSRNQGDVQAYDQGGKLKTQVPSGYYIDFTDLADDYGWERVSAGNDWRGNINAVNYWLFRKSGTLSWYQAMRELYLDSQLGGFAATATPSPTQPSTQQP